MFEIITDVNDFCPADYGKWICHTLPGKVAIKFTFPPQFLLVSEKWKISKFKPWSPPAPNEDIYPYFFFLVEGYTPSL